MLKLHRAGPHCRNKSIFVLNNSIVEEEKIMILNVKFLAITLAQDMVFQKKKVLWLQYITSVSTYP